ncbi:MAG: hypothetical protein V4659_00710 [Pseudomonadota bacterium]
MTAALFAAAGIGTALIPRPLNVYGSVFWGVAWLDLAMLLALVVLALLADRFWPIWLAALQLVMIGFHGVRGYDPTILPYAYWFLVGKLAYPQMALLIAGTVLHRRRRAAGQRDFAWTFQRQAAGR